MHLVTSKGQRIHLQVFGVIRMPVGLCILRPVIDEGMKFVVMKQLEKERVEIPASKG